MANITRPVYDDMIENEPTVKALVNRLKAAGITDVTICETVTAVGGLDCETELGCVDHSPEELLRAILDSHLKLRLYYGLDGYIRVKFFMPTGGDREN